MKADIKLIGNRPAGSTQDSSPLVQAVVAAAKATGFEPALVFGSTDSNIPFSLGVPAITLSRAEPVTITTRSPDGSNQPMHGRLRI